MKSEAMRHLVYRGTFAAALALGLGMTMQSCDDDTLTGQPSWLGNSIYERLAEEGNYQTTLKLIDDLGQRDVLSQTGSRTLFVADDAAYAEWFKNNEWGVTSYDQLTTAQKKLLFNSSVVTNAYLVELLSNVSGGDPDERMGRCMRRPTALSVYDSVYTIKPEEMPVLIGTNVSGIKDPWAQHRGKEKGIVLLKDNTPAPMIHFLPAFMQYNKITDEDLAILTNGKATSASEAWVNGQQIIERDITCKNGYIHKVAGVIEPADNMAEILRQQAKETDPNYSTKVWSRMIDRFSAPYYNEAATKEYNRLYNNTDSVFILRYFSEWSASEAKLEQTPQGEKVADLLPFDPGWNNYMYSNTMGYDSHYDAAVMIAPTDAALAEWFESPEGEGYPLKVQFGSWDSIPPQTLKELLGVNMVEDFYDNVPSKFENILDATTQLPLGIKPENVVKSFMGCNGVVYLTDKVFTPKSYSSVAFPAMVRENTLKVIYWAFDNLDFLPYLNSMDSYYSLIMPTNDAMLWYVEPTSYGLSQATMLEFYYNKDKKKVTASRFNCTIDEAGNIEKGVRVQAEVPDATVEDRLTDLVDQLIIVGNIEDGRSFYKTKGGTLVHVDRDANGGITVSGMWQMEHNRPIAVKEIYHQANGRSYEVHDQMPLASTKSVYQTLVANPEYSEFLDLFTGGTEEAKKNMMINTMSNKYKCAGSQSGNLNVRLFENYNYTVYAPTNQAIRKYIDMGVLPTWIDYEEQDSIRISDEASEYEREFAAMAVTVINERITNFIRYHLQDNSLAIGAEPVSNHNFESMLVNPVNGRFYPLEVSSTDNSLTVIDQLNQEHHVTMNAGLYNNVCREFWFNSNTVQATIYMESDAVVHQIDGVMMNPEWVDKNLWETKKEIHYINWRDEVDMRLKEGGTK